MGSGREQLGAGPYPASEPEVRALVEAIVDRPNITSYVGYHTFSGVHSTSLLRALRRGLPDGRPAAYKLMGEAATRLTGYPVISIFHDFKYDPKLVIKGGDLDWVYDFLGAFAWVTEFWSPQRAAGITDYHFIDWIRDHAPSDDPAILKLADEIGEGYVRGLVPVRAPTARRGRARRLGSRSVLVQPAALAPRGGGQAHTRTSRSISRWSARGSTCARSSPSRWETARTAYGSSSTTRGWLPTHVTQKALDRKAVRPIEVTLELPEGARVVTGKQREEAGQLPGRVERRAVMWWERRPLDERSNEGRVGRRGGRGQPDRGRRTPRTCGHGARRRRRVATSATSYRDEAENAQVTTCTETGRPNAAQPCG